MKFAWNLGSIVSEKVRVFGKVRHLDTVWISVSNHFFLKSFEDKCKCKPPNKYDREYKLSRHLYPTWRSSYCLLLLFICDKQENYRALNLCHIVSESSRIIAWIIWCAFLFWIRFSFFWVAEECFIKRRIMKTFLMLFVRWMDDI